ncbi:hypothetical protein G9A89_012826 [Geosiphon pyriformis]|nr:hypothetical protein G9A89_012826 [Geosiphon pyriformis]
MDLTRESPRLKRRNEGEDRRTGRENRRPRDKGRGREQNEVEESPATHLAGIIVMLGDNARPDDLNHNIEELSKILQADYEKFSPIILKTLKSCITELPMSAAIYGTLIGLINVSRPEIAGAILRFFAELTNANVIQPKSLLAIYDVLLKVLDESTLKMRRSDTIVKIVLFTLPFVGKRLHERVGDLFAQMLEKINRYFDIRSRQAHSGHNQNYYSILLSAVQPYRDQHSYSQDNTLTILWEQIRRISQDWECPILLKPWSNYDNVLITADQHDIPELVLPEDSPQFQYDVPEVVFKIFTELPNGTNSPEVPAIDSIEHFIIHDMIQDIIDIFEINRKECIRYLKEMPSKFVTGTLVQNLSVSANEELGGLIQDDSETNQLTDKALRKPVKNLNLEKIILEAVFDQIFKLPQPKYKPIYYHSLLTEACRSMPEAFPPVISFFATVGILFTRLVDMDVECCYRFWNWFAHHLSNFAFIWNWKEWEKVLELDSLHPQVCFVREALEKSIRYSYYERIKSTLPEEFLVLYPSSEPSTNFRYEKPDHVLYDLSVTLVSQLRSKRPNDQILTTLQQARPFYPEISVAEQDEIIRDLFLQCVLMVGSKSFSHVLNVIERYLPILQSLNVTSESRKHTVIIVADFWANNTQFLGILLDKLLNYRVIDAIAVISWLFSDKTQNDFPRSYVWEILKNTINKVNSRVLQLQTKLKKLEVPKPNDNGDEVPNTHEDSSQNLENSLNMVSREQKEVLLAVFQKFVELLTRKIKEYEDQDIQDPMLQWWFYWAYGFFIEVGRAYSNQMSTFVVTLETIFLTPEVNPRIEKVISIVKALSPNYDNIVET